MRKPKQATPAKQRSLLLEVDNYIERLFVPQDPVFEQALRDAAEAKLPPISVSPNEGKLLYLLTKICGARRVLEIGLLGGYSTIWLARSLGPKGRLVTLEVDEACIRCARQNLERAGLLSRVDIRHGDARMALQKMIASGEGPFDLVFIDADKQSYPVYLDYTIQLTRPGSLILADNVIRDGKVALDDETDPLVKGVQEFNRKLAANPNLEAILVTIMRETLDGLAIARVKD